MNSFTQRSRKGHDAPVTSAAGIMTHGKEGHLSPSLLNATPDAKLALLGFRFDMASWISPAVGSSDSGLTSLDFSGSSGLV